MVSEISLLIFGIIYLDALATGGLILKAYQLFGMANNRKIYK
jgi:hypothetical protein